jgi:hypothetical protein
VVNAQADAPEAEAAIEAPNRPVYVNAEISAGHYTRGSMEQHSSA